MLPLGHAALAYLCYVGYAALGSHRLPARSALLPLLIASQLPDLIDKPLAYVGVLTYGRSLAHSLFTFLLLSALVWWLARRMDDRDPDREVWSTTPSAFAIGYGSHLLGDSYRALLAGNVSQARFLLYPLYRMPASPADDVAPWVRMLRIYREMSTHPELELLLVAVAVFVGLRIYGHSRPSVSRLDPEGEDRGPRK